MKTKKFFNGEIARNLFIAIFCCLAMTAKADEPKFCMSYADYVAGKWSTIESLTEGRSKQACQIKANDNEFKFKTGDKQADALLKKQAFAISYGGQLYVNCRNLRNNDIPLEKSGYAQAYKFDGNKLCVTVYHINNTALMASLGADVAWFFVDTPARIALSATSLGLAIASPLLNNYRCFVVDSNANEKGRYAVTRMNDEYMTKLLANDTAMLDKYNAVSKKIQRQSAANVLAILVEKNLVEK